MIDVSSIQPSGQTARPGAVRPKRAAKPTRVHAKRDKRTEEYWRARISREQTDAPPVPSDDEVPASLRGGGRVDRAPKRKAAPLAGPTLREELAVLLRMANTSYQAIAPCRCPFPLSLRGVVHLGDCARMWALSDPEVEQLTDALCAEVEAHPAALARMQERLASWTPHLALLICFGGIVTARTARRPEDLISYQQLTAEQHAELSAWLQAHGPVDTGRGGAAAPAEAEPIVEPEPEYVSRETFPAAVAPSDGQSPVSRIPPRNDR